MRHRLAIAALLALLLLGGAGVARAELSQAGNLRLSFKGSFSPRVLPRHRSAPISIHVSGAISTTDGSTPPALDRMEIEINRHGHLATSALPACPSSRLQSTTTKRALQRCRPALVGRGSFGFLVNFPNAAPVPAGGKLLAFNGRRGHRAALLLHLYLTTPVRVTFVFPLVISHPRQGRFGTTLTATIPPLVNGAGTVTEIDLTIGRSYLRAGRRHGYLTASCDAPDGFPGTVFPLARGSFYFNGGQRLNTTLSRDCRVG